MASKRPSTSIAVGSTPKRSRKTLTLEQKLEVLERIDNGQKTSVIEKALKLNESTIRSIRSNGDKIRASAKAGAPMNSCKSSYARPVEMVRMEKMLATWIHHQNKTYVPVSYSLIHEKAKSIYNSLEGDDKKPFSASSGWFAKFRKRYNLTTVEEAVSSDSPTAEEGFPKQEFYINETDQHRMKLPDQIYISTEEATASGVKASKDRQTLLLGANANGDCKLEPVLVHHSDNSRALRVRVVQFIIFYVES